MRPRSPFIVLPLLALLLSIGCGDDDTGAQDADTSSDAAVSDGGRDVSGQDVGGRDASAPDAASADAASADAASVDGGPEDGGPEDAGFEDVAVDDVAIDVPVSSEVNVELTLAGDGVGGTNTLVRSGESLGCSAGDGTCNATLMAPAELEAIPPPWADFDGWVGGPCDGSTDRVCTIETGGDLEVEARFSRKANIAFVTEEQQNAGFGGVAAANARCVAAAEAANLPGTFVAFLATGDEDDAFAAIDTEGGWVDTRGNTIAEDIDVLRAGEMKHPIRFSEFRNELSSNLVYTGASTADVAPMNECDNWTNGEFDGGSATGGNLMHTGHGWRSGNSARCTVLAHFYCFGTELDRTPASAPEPAHVGFLSSRYTPSAELRPDDVCASDASDAGLAGDFRAFIATAGASAASKFPMRREIARPDGTLIGPALYRGGHLASPMNQLADGTYLVDSVEFVLTGAEMPTTAPTDAATTCDDWTDPIGSTSIGLVGDVSGWFFRFEQSCQFRSRVRLYCLPSN